MTKLALTLPGWTGQIPNQAWKFQASKTTLADVINSFGEVALYVGGFLMFFWAIWGVFDYLRAEGNKEALAKARKRIQWAIVGFIILIMSFFLSDVAKTILKPGVPDLSKGGTVELRK